MAQPLKKHFGKAFLAFSSLLILVLIVSMSLGSENIPFNKVIKIILSKTPFIKQYLANYSGADSTIIILIRFPRILLGVLAGLALAVSGSSMQGIFKNPMASPFILGVSAGGAFGAAVGIFLNLSLYLLPLIAFISAMTTAFTVFLLGRVGNRTDISTLLLAGLAMNFLMTALTSYALFISDPLERMGIVSWMWGSLNGTYWDEVIIAFPLTIIGIILVFAYSRDLNVIQTGEESAKQLGINVEKTKIIQLITSSLLAATVISFTGVIGFVGLIIPHASRLLIGPDYKKLIPLAGLLGAIFLVSCDTLSRISGEIWVGIITGLIGAPFFIYLLIKNRGETGW